MPKTPDKTIYEKFIAFKKRLYELIADYKDCKNYKEGNFKKTKNTVSNAVEYATREALEEMESHIRYEDDVMAVGDKIYFKSKAIFFDASGIEISAQSIAERIDFNFKNEKFNLRMNEADFTEFSRRWAFYALIGLPTNSKPAKDENLPQELGAMLIENLRKQVREEEYQKAYEQVQKDNECPFSDVSESKLTELMLKKCADPAQLPKFKGEFENGGVPKNFKGFK